MGVANIVADSDARNARQPRFHHHQADRAADRGVGGRNPPKQAVAARDAEC